MDIRTTGLADGELAWLAAGDPEAPTVLCLHGFPDTPHGFAPLLTALADAGWFAIAPWLPGYSPSAVAASGDYRVARVAATMAALCETVSPGRRVAVVGHDWGAGIAYALCAARPALVTRVVTLAVPHPSALAGALLSDYDQQKRSWYMFLFQQHGIAELALSADGMAFVRRLVADWSPGWAVPPEFLSGVAAAIGAPANLAAALGYYRAMFDISRPPVAGMEAAGAPIGTPLLYLHGADDGCVGAGVATATPPGTFTGEFRAEVLEGCGHFLLQERPEPVVARILDWLGPARA